MSKTILITGAAGKLGRQMTRHFVSAGDTVIAAGRRESALAGLKTFVADLPGHLDTIAIDLIGDGGAELVRRLAQRGLHPDAVVNNAVDLVNQQLPPGGQPTREQWRLQFELAATVPYELIMAMATEPESRLSAAVNIASMYGIVSRNPALYEDPAHEIPDPLWRGQGRYDSSDTRACSSAGAACARERRVIWRDRGPR